MLSISHIIIIFLVALVVLGPEKLPQVARVMGKVMADFRRITNDFRGQIEDEMQEMERQTRIRQELNAHPEYAQVKPVEAPTVPYVAGSGVAAGAAGAAGAAAEPGMPGTGESAAAGEAHTSFIPDEFAGPYVNDPPNSIGGGLGGRPEAADAAGEASDAPSTPGTPGTENNPAEGMSRASATEKPTDGDIHPA